MKRERQGISIRWSENGSFRRTMGDVNKRFASQAHLGSALTPVHVRAIISTTLLQFDADLRAGL